MMVCVALLRGINVGRARRIAMAELRELFEDFGYHDVRTLLNSGNVFFRAAGRSPGKLASSIEAAIAERFGFRARVLVLAAEDLASVVADNPLPTAGKDPSRFLVAFVDSSATLDSARALLGESWHPEAVAIGPLAAYLWCANGIIASRLLRAFTRATGDAATTRNWTTVLKLQTASCAR